MSVLYCFVQTLVMIGLIVEMALAPVVFWCNPTTVFSIFIAGTFLLCGLLHPSEILSLLGGVFYFLFLPTMYLLMMIYAVCNMHVVSWGTRENSGGQTEVG